MFIDITKRKRKCICCRQEIPSKVHCIKTSSSDARKLEGGSICFMCFSKMVENIEGAEHKIRRFCTIKYSRQCTMCTKEFTGQALIINQEIVSHQRYAYAEKFQENVCPECIVKLYTQLKEYEHEILIKSVRATL